MPIRKTIDLDFYVPVKDGERYIAACLESILNQTVLPRRLTVYYNVHSSDRTAEILKNYPLRVVDVEFPLSDARNFALDDLETEWIGCCDADVVLDPDWLERLWEKRDLGATVLSGNTSEHVQTVGDLFRSITSPHNWGRFDVFNPYMLVPDMLARRQRLKDMKGYKTGWVNYEDSEMALRLKEAGDYFCYVAGARATHHRQDDFVSCLDLRWRHSFRRQEKLFETEAGLKQKTLNNIALATVVYAKARELRNAELMQVLCLMPLHHFVMDVECHGKKNHLPAAQALDASLVQALRDWSLKLIGEPAEKFWEFFVPHANSSLAVDFLIHYATFLRLALSHLQWSDGEALAGMPESIKSLPLSAQADSFAVADDRWEGMQKTARLKTKELFGIETALSYHFTESQHFRLEGQQGALACFRQKIFPTATTIFTCRDLTEQLAGQDMKIYWTETFQGSSVLSFGPSLKSGSL